MDDLASMLDDYRLTTAEILYHMPDHRELLQTYVWQNLDRRATKDAKIRMLESRAGCE